MPLPDAKTSAKSAASLGIGKRRHKEKVKNRIIGLETRLARTENLLEKAMTTISTISDEMRVLQAQNEALAARGTCRRIRTSDNMPEEPGQVRIEEDAKGPNGTEKDFLKWADEPATEEGLLGSAMFAQLEMGTGNVTDLADYRLYTTPLSAGGSN